MPRPTDPFTPPVPSRPQPDKQTYMPPSIEQAMKKEQREEQGAAQPGMVTSPDPPSPDAPAAAPAASGLQEPQQSADSSYAFITDPEQPAKRSILQSLPGGNSIAIRIGVVAGGLAVLIILFAILRSLLGGGSDLSSLIPVVQDQQEMIHLVTIASQQPDLSSNNKSFVATLQLSMASSQAELTSYLVTNHKKINPKQINMKVSSTTDSQLATAATAGTYNQSFQQIMKDQLDTYGRDLQASYKQIKGKNGRVLLDDDYRQAQLLATQLNASPN